MTKNIVDMHAVAYAEKDPRALHIERALRRHGLSGMSGKYRTEKLALVVNVTQLYRNYGDYSIQERPSLSAYVLQLGNEIVDYVVDVLAGFLRRGDNIRDAMGALMLKGMSRLYQKATSMPAVDEMVRIMNRCDVEIMLIRLGGPEKKACAMTSRTLRDFADYLVSKAGMTSCLHKRFQHV